MANCLQPGKRQSNMPLSKTRWMVLGWMAGENEEEDKSNPILKGLQYARKVDRLREFVSAQQAAGVMSTDEVQQIEKTAEMFYKSHGVWTGPGSPDNRALHSLSETQALVALQLQGFHLMEKKLLELHPNLAEDLKNFLAADRSR